MTDAWRVGDFRQREGESADQRAVRLAGSSGPTPETPAAQQTEGAVSDAARLADEARAAEQSRAALAGAAPDSQALRRCKASIRALTAEDKARLARWFDDGMRG